MSSASKGRGREYGVRDKLRALGYYAARGPASKGNDLEARYLGDAGLPNLLVECGGEKKIISSAFAELREKIETGAHLVQAPLPIVARCVKRTWRYHPHEEAEATDDLLFAIMAAKELAA